MIAGGVVFVGGLAVVLALTASSSPEAGPELNCERVNIVSAEQGSLRTSSAVEAVLSTEWLDELDVPPPSRSFVEDKVSTSDGIVAVEESRDGFVASEATTAGDFVVFANDRSVARFKVEQGDDGSYFIAGVAYC